MTQPGAPGSAMPADESSFMRRLADLERQVRELSPSIAASFNTTVAKVVAFDSIGASGSGFSLDGSYAAKASGSLVAPEGFNMVTVMAVGNITANNTRAFDEYLSIQVAINGSGGGTAMQMARPSRLCSATASAIRTTSVSPGSTVTVEVRGSAPSVWAADGNNFANIDAILLFRKA